MCAALFDHRAPALFVRRACPLYLWCLAVLLIAGLALRIEAAIYGRQITSAVSALSTLLIGETPNGRPDIFETEEVF